MGNDLFCYRNRASKRFQSMISVPFLLFIFEFINQRIQFIGQPAQGRSTLVHLVAVAAELIGEFIDPGNLPGNFTGDDAALGNILVDVLHSLEA